MIHGLFIERVYALGGRPVLVVRADMKRAVDTLGLIPSDEPAAPDAMEMFILGRAYPRHIRATPREDGSRDAASPEKSPVFFDWFGKGSGWYDRDRNIAAAVVPGMRHYHPDFPARGIIRPLLDRMLVRRGYLPFHASAGRLDVAFLLAGGPGAGKSTLIAELMRRGADCFGDDRALVTADGAGPLLHRFPEYVRIPVGGSGRKRLVRPPRPGTVRAGLGFALFLEPDDGPCRAERIAPAEAAARLVVSVPPSVGREDRIDMGGPAAAVASAVESYVLRGWGAPGERAALVECLLGERTLR